MLRIGPRYVSSKVALLIALVKPCVLVFVGLYMFSINGFSQPLSTCDIMFVGFNADGDDDFAIVALRDITNTTIFFTDQETNEIGTTNEGVLQWNTGSTTIAAGCVVVFTDVSNDGLRSASVGTLIEVDNGFNLSGTGDGILAYIGPDDNTADTYLAGIENLSNAIGDITMTGLSACPALTITNGAHDDGSQYAGPRNTELSFSDYRDSLSLLSNWDTESSNGENLSLIHI